MSETPPTDNPYGPAAGEKQPGISREAALRKVSLPATLLLVTAVISLLSSVGTGTLPFFMTGFLEGLMEQMSRENPDFGEQEREQFEYLISVSGGIQMYISAALGLIGSLVMLIGAVKMKKLEGYAMSMAACICAIVPYLSSCCVCVFPMAIGIWGVVVLVDENVKQHFS